MLMRSLRLLTPWCWMVPKRLLAATLTTSLVLSHTLWSSQPAQAQLGAYCQLSPEDIAQKEVLRKAAFAGDKNAQSLYQATLSRNAEQLKTCRSRTWPRNQAIWIRLYPCDIRNGALDDVLDRIVNRGYNQVYVEVFYSGQVLLPKVDNRTPWPSVLQTPGTEKTDLLAQAIQKGRARGLKVYAWMFTLNFGYSYARRPDRQQALARNGKGQVALSIASNTNLQFEIVGVTSEESFIDPYSPQAKFDYYQLVQEVVKRRPDGVLFDYVRYPRGTGTSSIATKVQDLWIFGEASQQAMYRRALNNKGLELMRRFLSRGFITVNDVQSVNKLFPGEREPLWQGRSPSAAPVLSANQQLPTLQGQLWYLSVAHAVQGVLDFLATAVLPVQKQGIPAGAVFFPDANRVVGQGFDSRLQAWDQFPASLEWHPMAYATCGNTSCIVKLIQNVLTLAPRGTQVMPVIAGVWGQSVSNRPPLEAQMQAIYQVAPQLNSVSHFAYSWQEPQSDRDRKFCRVQ